MTISFAIGVRMAGASVALVVAEHRMRYVAVRYDLNGAVVVAQLLGSDDIRVVAVYVAVYAYDGLDDTRHGAYVVRYHHDSHAAVQTLEHGVKFAAEAAVDKIGRLVENQQPWIGYYGAAQQRSLHLAARYFSYGF